ncbi:MULTISPECIES: peroxidase family protein [Moorena]|uniref:Animal hem peroxidase family protein n=1 Tax=Moorena producens 3L TaxID=489825 RepID=F4XYD0_9CYAN|nr:MULTISPECIES: peroxidase family protein [Moorena]NEQ14423.1 peroxidase [Moorena sp. SIO3E2]EGJ30343.1 animal hem peroxidase family protein [Moorena producens 3L]NEP65663.1 peroxidase [Moorena sp. SIO3A5]NEQ08535.1 peroxidase [Moorena sp. SIO4E2]NER85987.1 peroxidase [Moorena sp. SIO3A2]
MTKKPWHEFPTPLALLKLNKFRDNMREENLHDTSQLPTKGEPPEPTPSPDGRHLKIRTADGSFNDPNDPKMGMAGTRFGRNVALKYAYPDEKNLLNPNPRTISRKLLTRDEFVPASTLNLTAAAWIQFQTHDWFSHGYNESQEKIEIPLEQDDPWPEEHRPLEIETTPKDPTRSEDDTNNPPTFINRETHWWDASQIYGSYQETIDKVRSHVDGKMIIGDDGLLPVNPENGIDIVGFDDNWWIGLSMLHILFVKEHNTICDHLKKQYPDWTDDDLFDHARLINAALLAKIHTVEWTPGILGHPAVQVAMRANWWGLLGQEFKNRFGRLGDSEAVSGIIGSSTDHHGAPFYLTEEFVSVYRMHPLIPDEFPFYSVKDGKELLTKDFFEVSGKRSRAILEQVDIADLFYSFGISHPGAVTLYNYPKKLQQLLRDNGEVFDLAAVDILRDRERGVPRYNQFRELIGRDRVKSFEEITEKPEWAKELREVYNNDIDSVDLMIGMFAENPPKGFGFSDTAFRIFILMASRRLKSDRFFTKDYTAEIYTQFGLDWIEKNTFISVVLRHYPSLAASLKGVENGFAPWKRIVK